MCRRDYREKTRPYVRFHTERPEAGRAPLVRHRTENTACDTDNGDLWYAANNKGGAVKTVWICALCFSLAIVASSGNPAPGSTRKDNPEASLATYLFLHQTWNARAPAPTAAALNVCSE